jgi:hypothetical protein
VTGSLARVFWAACPPRLLLEFGVCLVSRAYYRWWCAGFLVGFSPDDLYQEHQGPAQPPPDYLPRSWAMAHGDLQEGEARSQGEVTPKVASRSHLTHHECFDQVAFLQFTFMILVLVMHGVRGHEQHRHIIN